MKAKRVIAVHLLNDFSGSPFVLKQSLGALVEDGYAVELFTATPSGNGFLSNINEVKQHNLFYQWNKNKLITLFLFLYSQLFLFVKLFFHLKKKDIVYINSILPFGGALAAKLKGCKVLYHIHEVSIKPALLKSFLLFVANRTAASAIFVSEDLRKRTAFHKKSCVVYNALPAAFIRQAIESPVNKRNSFHILMLCSLKKYKGVFEFIECAKQLPEFSFRLVLNTSKTDIKDFFSGHILPANLELLPAQQNVHTHYKDADIVMNLSRPDEWIETFGMTVLEAMYYKKPVIVPPIGGITELVADEKEGYHISCYNIENICSKLKLLAEDKPIYEEMSMRAFSKAKQFTSEKFGYMVLQQASRLSEDEYAVTVKTAAKQTAF